MFSGHVIYEMSAGRELSRLVPNEMDLRCVEDASCREILQYVFSRKDDGKFKRGIIKASADSAAIVLCELLLSCVDTEPLVFWWYRS